MTGLDPVFSYFARFTLALLFVGAVRHDPFEAEQIPELVADRTDEEQREREAREVREDGIETGHHGTPSVGPANPAWPIVRRCSPVSASSTPTTP